MKLLKTLVGSGIYELGDYLTFHVLTCLIPAFFIAGGIAALVSTGAVIKYFGPQTKKHVSYGVASVSGILLAVCSCTILPLFGGIYRKGAGLGPAITFLYSGPAINLLAIVLTARAIGFELGAARAVGAIVFSIVIGLIMAFLYRSEETEKNQDSGMFAGEENPKSNQVYLIFFGLLLAILLVGTAGISVAARVGIILTLIVTLWLYAKKQFTADEIKQWLMESYKLAKLIFPVLLIGVFVAGMLKVILPEEIISSFVGGNSFTANFLASLIGAVMYFSTLTEVPIIKALLDLGMGEGPALALLLAGPAVSLPNMLVVRKIMGTKKTITYVLLVVIMATITGMIYGNLVV